MTRFFCAIFLVISPPVAFSADTWWLNADFTATEMQILGTPVRSIDPSFDKVSLLTRELVTSKFKAAREDLTERETFAINKTRDGNEQRILVGVYSAGAEKGSFLLVVQKHNQNWKTVFLSKQPGKMRFSVLQDLGSTVLWNDCLECGHSAALEWNKKRGYYFAPPTSEGAL